MLIDTATCKYLYDQLILPILDYSDFVYDGCNQYSSFTLQRLQNGAARRMLQVPRLTPSVYTHQELHMDFLTVRRKKHICIMLYKILNDLAPSKLRRYFTYVNEISIRETRGSSDMKLYIKKPRLELTKRSFAYRAATQWNLLPLHVRLAETLDIFKTLLDDYFRDI